MEQTLYIGVDESYGCSIDDNLVLVATFSRNHIDIMPEDYIEKRRDFDREPFFNNFLFLVTQDKRRPPSKYINLFHQVISRFANPKENIKIFMDSPNLSKNVLNQIYLHPQISPTNTRLITRGDKTLPLLNRADHLANMIYHIYSPNQKSIGRVTIFNENFPQLNKILEENRIHPIY
jgi:hypothetical protein